MIEIIGLENCARCIVVKNILNDKKIEYKYSIFEDFTKEQQDNYMQMARMAKQLSFPLIIKDDKIISLTEVN